MELFFNNMIDAFSYKIVYKNNITINNNCINYKKKSQEKTLRYGKHKKDGEQKRIQQAEFATEYLQLIYNTKMIYNIKKSPKEFKITPSYDLIIRKVLYSTTPKMYLNINQRNSRNVTFLIIMELYRNYFTTQSSKPVVVHTNLITFHIF